MHTPSQRTRASLLRHHYLFKAAIVWAGMAVVESVHGVLRAQFLLPVVGDLGSRQIGVVTGSGLILAMAYFSMRWIAAQTRAQELAVGAVWVLLMGGFEITLGRMLGFSWARIAADYDPAQGGLMLFAMLFLLLAPWIAARWRSTQSTGRSMGRSTGCSTPQSPSPSPHAHSRH